MIINNIITVCSLLVNAILLGSPNTTKQLIYSDKSYEEEIRSVLLYPINGSKTDQWETPIARVGEKKLLLKFDDLVEKHESYKAMVRPATYDWKPSNILPLTYLDGYNEFNITNYKYSTNTKINYIQYEFLIPRIKLSGNFLLVIFRGNNQEDIIITRRFMIVNNQVSIAFLREPIGKSSISRNGQHLNFKVNYENLNLINPTDNIHVFLRQNQQWYNAKSNLQPTMISNQSLTYQYFDNEYIFEAGNEFRFFDLRSIRHPGQRIKNIDLSEYPSIANIMLDVPRSFEQYSQYNDINGNFLFGNYDIGDVLGADYLNVIFKLKLKKKTNGEIYVLGKMNDYLIEEKNKMKYNKKLDLYENTQILKQGFYNYKYIIVDKNLPMNYIENNHFETENDYEIFVYYSSPTFRGDELIGYKKIVYNPRNK